MANARDEGRNFLRVYSLENFKIFNPRYKECLTGREWAMLMYLLNNRLLYIRRDEDFMNGNWIKMDAKEKDKLMKTLDVFKIHLCAEEYVYLLALNSKCRLLGIFEVAHGIVDGCMLNTRELMVRNLLCGASSFVVVHNHPSGVLELSRNDVETTKQICSASELMGITMLDHIVIARAEEGREEYAYFSMKDHGLMQK